MEKSAALLGMVSGFWSLVSLGLAIAFFVVAFMVKRTRPDAFGVLVSGAVVGLLNATLGSALVWMLPVMMARTAGSAESYMAANMISMSFRMLLSVASTVLTLIGIARLARPPFHEPGAAFAEGRYQ